jgi:DNA-binding NtrC family response regulator
MEKIKVLFVDDEEDYVRTLAERMDMRDVGSTIALDGNQALKKLEGEVPDVMVLDLRMPGPGGLEVLEKVKKKYPGVEVIILTGHGSHQDEQTARQLGAFDYLNKPTDLEGLLGVIKKAYAKSVKYLKEAREDFDRSMAAATMAQGGADDEARKIMDEPTPSEKERAAAAPREHKILFVDDEEDFVTILAERMESRDLGGDVALDGEKALQMVEADPPDVMVLDVRLPGMDGLEVLERVKEKYPGTEVIIMTGYASEEDEKRALELGAFRYLKKPVEIEELVAVVRDACSPRKK